MKKTIFLCGAAMAFAAAAQTAALPMCRKSCVYLGWDVVQAPVKAVYEHRGEFAAAGFDGIVMNVNGVQTNGASFFGRRVMASHRFAREQFEPVVPMVKELLAIDGLKESLWCVYWMGTTKHRIGWVDDAAWAEFTGNMRFVCALAKELGFKGLFIDHEDYTGKPLFVWRMDDDPPYAECAALARRRGAETARAMAEGDPNVRFVMDRVMMQLSAEVRSQTPHESTAARGDLWYPFLNGFVEGMAPGMVIVDGCESAYGAKTRRDYAAQIGDCRASALVMLEPNLRTKYLAQSEMSFGKYLDGMARTGLTMENGIPQSLFGAGACCDRLFWVYGERNSVVNWGKRVHPKVDVVPWSERMPGLPAVLRVAVGDFGELRAKAAAGALENLVSNPGCEAKGKGTVPAPFQIYGGGKEQTAEFAAHDAVVGCAAPGSIRFTRHGLSLTFKRTGVKEGERIYVSFAAKGSDVLGDVVWTKGGAWCWNKSYQFLAKPSATLKDGWRRYECALVAPEDVEGVGIIISTRAKPDAPSWLDDISLYRW